MKDIADAAGVAVSTVSRVLNDRKDGRISEPTRKRVLEIAQDLGYRPDRHAQALASGASSAISIVTSTRRNLLPVDAERVLRIHEMVGSFNRQIVTTDLSWATDPGRAAGTILAERPEISVWASVTWDAQSAYRAAELLHEAGVSAVIIDQREPLPADTPADVLFVERDAMRYLATRHLLDLGHRHIALLPSRVPYFESGYLRALEEVGLSDGACIATGEVAGPSEARVAVLDMMASDPEITAFVCRSDMCALGAMSALRDMNMRVPEDASLVGYGDELWAAYLDVPLTTVAHPLDELIKAAHELLARRLSEPDAAWEHVELDLELVVRASTGAPRTG